MTCEQLTADGAAVASPTAPGLAPAWLAVGSLSVGTFATVTTEFLPIGLLSSIAAGLKVSEGVAGLMVTMPGVAAALAGPLLIVAAGRLDRRTVLLSLSALLVASNLLAAAAPDFTTMLVARLLLGLCVGGFWTFAPGTTTHLVPAALQPRALSYVLAGISVATVAGVPAGALLGSLAGWRTVFGVAAVVSFAVFLLQLRLLPRMPPARATKARDLLVPLTRTPARMGLLISLFLICGHFAAYTYLGPVLQQVYGLSTGEVASLLLVYGVAGFVGTFVGGRLVAGSVRGTLALAAAMVCAVLLVSAWLGGALGAGALLVLVWGAAFGLIPVATTGWMLQALPDAPEAGQALLVTFFQVAIASGALFGGRVVDGYGVTGAMLLGGALSAVAVAAIGGSRLPKVPSRATT